MFKFSKRSETILSTVDKRLQLLANEVLKTSPYDFAITSGYRTQQEQMQMYIKKVSKCDGIEKKSKHQLRKAIDIMVYDEHGVGTWEEKYYQEVAKAFKETAKKLNETIYKDNKINIIWGGDWKSFKDYPHFEMV